MPININDVIFNNGGTVLFNGDPVKSILFNGTEVWRAELYLYDSGNQFTDVTGGWVGCSDDANITSYINLSYSYNNRTCIRIRSKGISDALGGDNTGAAIALTTNKIDLTGYSNLNVTTYSTGETGSGSTFLFLYGLYTTKTPTQRSGATNSGYVSGARKSFTSDLYNKWSTSSINISSITGSYYVGVVQRGNVNYEKIAYINKVWLS